MAVNDSLRPISPKAFDLRAARHLLNRAGFGGTPQQVAALQAMGLDGAVDFLVDYEKIDRSHLEVPQYDADLMRPPTLDERRMLAEAARGGNPEELRARAREEFLRRQAEDRAQMNRIELWWLGRMIATPRPLEEKLVLLWHGHFATNHRTVHDSYLMLKQNATFRDHAAGNFADLAHAIVRDPAMIKFLNNEKNRKEKPNENLARELMELFTLGEGNYTEDDIKQGARALTGYGISDNDFHFYSTTHDHGQKTILGKTANFDGDSFVDQILTRPQCAIWVSFKLYKHFVADVEDRERIDPAARSFVHQCADLLRDQRYELKPVLRALFKSQHFYDPSVVGNLIKSPAQFTVSAARTLGTPTRSVATLAGGMMMMGQKLFDPPSVAGWDGGRGWVNTSTLFVRQNIAAYMLSGKLPFEDGWSRDKVDYDPMALVKHLPEKSPEKVVDEIAATMIARPLGTDRRDHLVKFMKERSQGINSDSMLGLLLLVTALPEYQVC